MSIGAKEKLLTRINREMTKNRGSRSQLHDPDRVPGGTLRLYAASEYVGAFLSDAEIHTCGLISQIIASPRWWNMRSIEAARR